MNQVRFHRIRSSTFFSSHPERFGWRFLLLLILLVYVPFMGSRVVRPAGDDKLYVSQAIEMAQQGTWFLQSFAGEPNYYKGPLHYLLLRVGFFFFGSSMWATVYMNLIAILIGAWALGRLVARNRKEEPGWAFWAGMAFAVNAGIYSHAFASQMEVEAAALYALGLYLLDRSGPGKPDLKFWLVVGLLGWLKSPLHSVLLGSSAILFWAWSGELLPRLFSPRAWFAVLMGVLLCVGGYAPMYLLDKEHFVNAYVLRETLWKPPNGSRWHYPVIPFFTYFLLPWTLPALVAYADGISRLLWRRRRTQQLDDGTKRILALGLVAVIPSVAFFIWHPYRGQNYNLPVISGLILVVTALWSSRTERWSKWYAFSLGITALVVLLVPLFLTLVARHFSPMPFWWPRWQILALWVGAFFTARGLWIEGMAFRMVRPASLARRVVWLFLAVGTLCVTIGEREMVDIRDRIYTAQKNREPLTLSYYNLQKDIWSEWGYLNFMIPYKVKGLFTEAQLLDAIRNKEMILVPGERWLEEMQGRVKVTMPNATFTVEPWRRWMTKGKNPQGIPSWKDAWNTHDLTRLERNYYMVRVNL